MSILEEIEVKLDAAQNRAEDILQDLHSFSSIKEGLISTDATLTELAERIEILVSGLNRNINGLSEMTASLKQAIDTIKQTDPAQVVKGQKLIEENLGGIHLRIDLMGGTIKEQHDALKVQVKVRDRIIDEAFQSVGTKNSVIIWLLFANLAVSGYLILKLVP